MATGRIGAVLAAFGLIAQPAPTLAQTQPCLTERETSAIAIYSVPSLILAVRLRCADRLSPSGYLARGGDALSGRYAALQESTWPAAKSGLLKMFIGIPEAGSLDLGAVAELPDKDVRPFVDALIVQELQPKIALGNCPTVERVLETMASLDPQAAGSLLGMLGGFTGMIEAGSVPLCPRRP